MSTRVQQLHAAYALAACVAKVQSKEAAACRGINFIADSMLASTMWNERIDRQGGANSPASWQLLCGRQHCN